MMEPEIELLLMVLAAFAIACGLFYGMAFVVQRVRLLWIEIESNRIDMLAKRAQVKMALDQNDLQTQVIRPDASGLLPVSRKMVDAGMTTEAALQIALAFIESQRTHAPTAHTLTWSPHYSNKSEGGPVLVEPEQIADNWMAPNFQQLISDGAFQPGRFLLGYSMEDHSPVHGTWKDIYSCAVGGQPGTGKSTATRSLLAQSAMGGCKFVVVDPHYGAGEDSLGESLQPLRRAMLCDVASNDKTTIEAVRYIDSIGKARMHGDKDRSPIMLVVDEATSLFSRSGIGSELSTLLEAIAQEYRKVGVFALCLGQIWTASRTGGDSGLRDSFASALVCKMKRSQARMLVSTEVAKEVEVLGIGQAILWKTSGEYARLNIPNCTQADIEVVAKRVFSGENKASTSITPVSPLQKPLHTPLHAPLHAEDSGDVLGSGAMTWMTAREQQALNMFRDGASPTEIVKELWGVNGGKAYTDAAKEFNELLRSQIGGR
jgi:hypothetical protein